PQCAARHVLHAGRALPVREQPAAAKTRLAARGTGRATAESRGLAPKVPVTVSTLTATLACMNWIWPFLLAAAFAAAAVTRPAHARDLAPAPASISIPTLPR